MREGSTVLFRADASSAIGAGHLMRCMALAEAWVERAGSVTFVMNQCPRPLISRLTSCGATVAHSSGSTGSVEDAERTANIAEELTADWIITDGYQFDHEYHRILLSRNLSVLRIDDAGGLPAYEVDIVLNQNLHARDEDYRPRRNDTRVLLGPEFILLRNEFRGLASHHRKISTTVERIFVTLGGADPTNQTRRILGALSTANIGAEIVAVLGPANTFVSSLHEEFGDRRHLRILQNPPDLAMLMQNSDLAICSGGSTVWELAHLGIPALVGITAPVEARLAAGLEQIGLFQSVGWFQDLDDHELRRMVLRACGDVEWRREMAISGSTLVDGRGRDRVCEAMSR